MARAFKIGLVLRSKTKKEVKLPETAQVNVLNNIFCIDSKKEYLYQVSDELSPGMLVFTVSPLNKIKKIDYKSEILDMTVSRNSLVLLNNTALTIFSKSNFNVFSDDFKNSKLCQIFQLDALDFFVGVQSRRELQIFDCNLKRIEKIKCQCSFSARDVLLIADMNILKVYVASSAQNAASISTRMPIEISLPDYITCILTDVLFSKIYCATQDNRIYVIDLSGKPRSSLDYHNLPVLQMKMSFCGKFLYSSDGKRICVWNVKNEVVVGFVDVEEGIDQMDLILTDDREYSPDNLLI